jgi:hypothetical protein
VAGAGEEKYRAEKTVISEAGTEGCVDRRVEPFVDRRIRASAEMKGRP